MAEYSTSRGSIVRANPSSLSTLYSKISQLVTNLNYTWGSYYTASGRCAGWSVGSAPSTPSYSVGARIYAPDWVSDATAYHNSSYYSGTLPSKPSAPSRGDLISASSLTNATTYINSMLKLTVSCNWTACTYSVCSYTSICGGCCES